MQKTKAVIWLFPENIRRVEKQADSYFLGSGCSGNSRGNPWSLFTSLHFVRLPSSWPSHGQDSSCWLLADDPGDVGDLISGSSVFSKTSLNIWTSTVHMLLKPGLENFEHYFASVWDECNCAVVWAFFGIALLWDWNENWLFPVLWPLLSFPNLLAYWVHCHSIIF